MVKWKKTDVLSLCEARWRTEDWVNLHERGNTLKSFGKRHNPLSIIPGWFLWLPTHPSWTYMHVNHSLWRKHDPASCKWTSFYELKAWIPKKPLDLKRLKKKVEVFNKTKPMDHRIHGILQARQNTGVGSLSLLQGIFPTQGSNLGLLHCRRLLYQLSFQGSPKFGLLQWPGIKPGSAA